MTRSILPPPVFRTWMLLRSLVQEGADTPPLSLQQLVEITDQARSTFYRHLAFLKANHVLDWRTAGRGELIISFASDLDGVYLSPGPGHHDSRVRVVNSPAGESESQNWDESLKSGTKSLKNGKNCLKIEKIPLS